MLSKWTTIIVDNNCGLAVELKASYLAICLYRENSIAIKSEARDYLKRI